MKKLWIRVTLEHKDKEYQFIDDHSDFNFEGCDNPSDFWWTEGNGSCDCNRSLYIKRHCECDFKEMLCGDTIELVDLEFIGDWKECKVE